MAQRGLGNGHVIMDSREMVEFSGVVAMPTAGFTRLAVAKDGMGEDGGNDF